MVPLEHAGTAESWKEMLGKPSFCSGPSFRMMYGPVKERDSFAGAGRKLLPSMGKENVTILLM